MAWFHRGLGLSEGYLCNKLFASGLKIFWVVSQEIMTLSSSLTCARTRKSDWLPRGVSGDGRPPYNFGRVLSKLSKCFISYKCYKSLTHLSHISSVFLIYTSVIARNKGHLSQRTVINSVVKFQWERAQQQQRNVWRLKKFEKNLLTNLLDSECATGLC